MASSEATPVPGVTICDVAPRDGLQNLARLFTVAERIALIRRLAAAGLRRIEAVSFVSPRRVPQMAEPEAVLAGLGPLPGVRIAGLALNLEGARRALASGIDEVRFVIVASETFSRRNQGAGIAATLDAAREAAGLCRAAGRSFTAVIAAGFGCPFEGRVDPTFVASLAGEAVQAGAGEVVFADTIGAGVPADVRALARLARPHLGGRSFGFHFHNTRNAGYANALAALDMGASVLDASTAGLGGCPFAPGATGNVATEDLHWLLRQSGIATGLDGEALLATARWLGGLVPDAAQGQTGTAGFFPEVAAARATAGMEKERA